VQNGQQWPLPPGMPADDRASLWLIPLRHSFFTPRSPRAVFRVVWRSVTCRRPDSI